MMGSMAYLVSMMEKRMTVIAPDVKRPMTVGLAQGYWVPPPWRGIRIRITARTERK